MSNVGLNNSNSQIRQECPNCASASSFSSTLVTINPCTKSQLPSYYYSEEDRRNSNSWEVSWGSLMQLMHAKYQIKRRVTDNTQITRRCSSIVSGPIFMDAISNNNQQYLNLFKSGLTIVIKMQPGCQDLLIKRQLGCSGLGDRLVELTRKWGMQLCGLRV